MYKRSPEGEQRRLEAIRNSKKMKEYHERQKGAHTVQIEKMRLANIGNNYSSSQIGKPHHMSDEWLSNIQEANKKKIGTHHSLETRKVQSDSHKGENNYLWAGGKQRYSQTGTSFEAKEWQQKVYERDNNTCQECGKENLKGMNRIAHHIKDWDNYPELRFEVDNGKTVCRSCHKKIHPALLFT